MTDLASSIVDPVAAVAATPDIPPAAPKQTRKRTTGKPRTRAKVERPPAAPIPPKRGRPPAVTPLVDQLRALYGMMGAAAMIWRPDVGATILAQSEQCAQSVNALAEANPAVKRALVKGMMAGQIMGVVMAHAPIVLAIATPARADQLGAGDQAVPDLDAMWSAFAERNPGLADDPDSESDAAPAAD